MKTVSQDNSSSNTEVKSAELVLLLDGLRVDPAVLSQTHELYGEQLSARSPLNDGVRARNRLRNALESMRSMARPPNLRVSIK